MGSVDPTGVQQLLSRREAAALLGCSVRTVSRRISEGSLTTAYRANGQRGIIRASVMALRAADTLATDDVDVAQTSATAWPAEAVQLAVAHATLAQAVQAHLDAGFLARKQTRAQLRDALERSSDARAALEAVVSASSAPALPAGDAIDQPADPA